MLVTKRKPGSANIPAGWGTRHIVNAGVKRLPKYSIPEIAVRYKIDEDLLYAAFLNIPNPPKPFVTNRGKLNYYEAREVVLWYRKGKEDVESLLRGGVQQQAE